MSKLLSANSFSDQILRYQLYGLKMSKEHIKFNQTKLSCVFI